MTLKKFLSLFLFVAYSCTFTGTFAPLYGVLTSKKPLFKSNATEEYKVPFVYTPHYNVTAYGLVWLLNATGLHQFDGSKYGKVFNSLCSKYNLSLENFHQPEKITDEQLLRVHTPEYLESLKSSWVVSSIFYLQDFLSRIPNSIFQSKVLDPMRYATGGTLLAVDLAQKYGGAINLSGGYHHAKKESGEGFCVFADINLAMKKILDINPSTKILYIDLDAHQGNGVESICGDSDFKANVILFDMYNQEVYPGSWEANRIKNLWQQKKEGRLLLCGLPRGTNDQQYLETLRKHLADLIAQEKPSFVIYNAGTDILAGDPYGQLAVSKEGIVQRDEIVFKSARDNNIPIMMVLSGGYTPESAQVIAQSIENLIDKNILQLPEKIKN